MKKTVLPVLLIAALFFAACKGPDEKTQQNSVYTVYDLSDDGLDLVADTFVMPKEQDTSKVVGKLLQRVIDGPENIRSRSAVPESVENVKYVYGARTVGVDLGASFADEKPVAKVLCEAAIVRTLCGLDDIYAVSFSAGGSPLTDSQGVPMGLLTEGSFVENEGAAINAYERAELHLFFASIDGQSLVEKVENVTYNGNISLDRVVVDSIISGPRSTDAFETVNPQTTVNSVTTQDGICYVNLSKDFLNKITNVTDEVMIYSLVNSLTQLGNVNKVQILIDGDTDVKLGAFDLSSVFERNLEMTE